MNTNQGRVYFAFDGDDFDPDAMTKFLGITPTSIQRKGSKLSGKIPKANSWELSTENIVSEYVDIYELSNEIVNKLRPKKELILQAKKHFNITPRLQVVLWFSIHEQHSTPEIGFETETVQFLGEIGALIDIDTYKH